MALNFVSVVILTAFLPLILLKMVFHWHRKTGRRKTVGFFHPYCNAGGGGEKVMWCAINALQKKYPKWEFVIYTGDVESPPNLILKNAKERFNISLERGVTFVYLRTRFLVEAKMYPIFTLLGQSIGSVILGLEALFRFLPDVYVDSMGYAFTFPLFKYIGGCHIACYVHYPTISTDMLHLIQSGAATYNNRAVVSRSPLLSRCKLIYYQFFAAIYGFVGSRADLILVHLVYPPCQTEELSSLPLLNDDEKPRWDIVSVAQFRPEKNHELQLRAFKCLLEKAKALKMKTENLHLILIGGCRHAEDEMRVNLLKDLAKTLDIDDQVQFHLNVSFSELKEAFQNGTIGLHTMWNEHFGIGVVDGMAAGLIMVAHNSGGPKMDIVISHGGNRTGFLADDEESFAGAILEVMKMSSEEKRTIQLAARQVFPLWRESVERFSMARFEESILNCFRMLLSE
ncbi:unnamed protein product [Darwinula stevensoni]|uniref:GDP-Man:Man(3)GlcNAc(2)-PP-Dol alpha-1,2-mannosyltransferase n=1 Tax=Darwinula stevensoni TaxID=69355 RepID=A0A7R8X6R1_9CRUS|nr:unnamed protein product [Darwinula stevensoni]CAG0881548.1 unnamed protein product [Darwinula stevensoni]